MAKKPAKPKQGKVDRLALETVQLITQNYRDFLDDVEASYRGKNYQGRVKLVEPLKLKNHGKLRMLLMKLLVERGFNVIFVIVEHHNDTDSVFFSIGRNDR